MKTNFIKTMLDSYLEAALWADGAEHWQNVTEPTRGTQKQALADCVDFMLAASGNIMPPRTNVLAERLGHDLWLTRQGHGTGFWDKPHLYGEHHAEQLTRIAKQMGERKVYHAGGKYWGIE